MGVIRLSQFIVANKIKKAKASWKLPDNNDKLVSIVVVRWNDGIIFQLINWPSPHGDGNLWKDWRNWVWKRK